MISPVFGHSLLVRVEPFGGYPPDGAEFRSGVRLHFEPEIDPTERAGPHRWVLSTPAEAPQCSDAYARPYETTGFLQAVACGPDFSTDHELPSMIAAGQRELLEGVHRADPRYSLSVAGDALAVAAADDGGTLALPRARGDYNGDGRSDVLWMNDVGSVLTWLMDGSALLSAPFIAAVPPDWNIADGAGDYDGDGQSDVLWRNDDGWTLLWLMNGAAIVDNPFVEFMPTAWKIADASGDYNGDGKSDVLWRNDDGTVRLWLMDGANVVGNPIVAGVPIDWTIGDGAGDYNGDGKSDVLWRNDNSSALIWFMDGGSIASASFIPSVPSVWQIVDGAGDYNGDGKSDILWHFDSANAHSIWFMNGASIVSNQLIFQSDGVFADGASDNNGDGKSDILWRNQNGDISIWLMDGAGVISDAYIASVPADWHIQA